MSGVPDNRNSYGSIIKSIGLFGGVKVFQIIVNIIKNKFVAILLGPAGMGIAGLLTSTTNMVNSITGCGLHTSSVRDIAHATSSRDEDRIGLVVSVLRKLVWATGVVGALLTFFLAPLLSQWSFGNDNYAVSYRLISIILIFDQLCTGQTALMQGTFHYRYMASSALFGSVIGLIISVPLYYLWGERAIAPVIIITSITNLFLSWHYSNKIQFKKIKLSLAELWSEGKGMIILGSAIALTGFIGTGKTYLLRTFISRYGDIADVGLYTAGIAIATQYIDIILQSMGSDYSPRLAAVSDDKLVFTETINRQLKLMVTIVTPLIVPFVVFIKELTILLYSDKFIAITGMIEWIMIGMFFRTTSWCLSYAMVAKGESRKFLFNESFSAFYTFLFSIIGYLVGSFSGMGIAFCVGYFFYTLQMYLMCKKNFDFSLNRDTIQITIALLSVLMGSFVILKLLKYSLWRYIIGIILVLIVGLTGLKILNEMIPVKEYVNQVISRFNSRR